MEFTSGENNRHGAAFKWRRAAREACPALRVLGPPPLGLNTAKSRLDGPSPRVSQRTVCRDNEKADLWLPD